MVKYAYDAFGNCKVLLDTAGLSTVNPIRYRSYYYDHETKLYYLNARYYNPEWRRFISPDSTDYLDPESVNGLNLYCYCYNDPVNYADPSGWSVSLILGLIGLGIGIGVGFGYAAYTDYQDDNDINGSVGWKTYLGYSMLGGALGYGLGYFWPSIASFLGSSFSFTLPSLGTLNMGGALALVGGTTITITGAQIAGVAIAAGLGIMLFASDHRPGNNRVQNKQLKDAVRKTGHDPNDPRIKDKINKIEKYIRSKKLDLGWKELVELVRRFLE